MQTEQVGFIGTNNAGVQIAMQLQAALAPLGRSIMLFTKNKNSTTFEKLMHSGVTAVQWCDTTRLLATKCSIVFSMVSDCAALEEMCFGDEGLLGGLNEGSIHVDMSTLLPSTGDRMVDLYRNAGCTFVVASLMARGDGEAVVSIGGCDAKIQQRLNPYLEVIAKTIIDAGRNARDAYVMKLLNSMFLTSVMETMAEGMTLAEKAGVSRGVMLEYINRMFPAPVFQECASRMAKNQFEATGNGVDVQQGLNDVGNVLQLGRMYKVNLPVARIVHDHLEETVEQGRSRLDVASLVTVVREESGLAPLYRSSAYGIGSNVVGGGVGIGGGLSGSGEMMMSKNSNSPRENAVLTQQGNAQM